MGTGYILINNTKKEYLDVSTISGIKLREIAGNPSSSAIVAWYLLKNSGDEIGFVPDNLDNNQVKEGWPFENISWEIIGKYKDVTEKTIQYLIEEKILKDEGKIILDENEPDVFVRKLKNIWMD